MQQVLKESLIGYNDFLEAMVTLVKNEMGKNYTVSIVQVTKNNSLVLDSLVILKEGKNYAPNIYMMPYYEAYLQGANLMELTDQLCSIYRNCDQPISEGGIKYTYEDMKSKIIYRLVSCDKNQKLLSEVPHIKYLDLAITFHCLVHNDTSGIGTIRITNEHMKQWEVSQQEIWSQAVKNTGKYFPAQIRCMDDVIRGIMTAESDSDVELSEDLRKELFPDRECAKQHKMYVLTNRQGINGATCLLYDNILRNFSESIHSDLYILPSSIHEVILVPYIESLSKETLTDMVKEVNSTQVAVDEVLSDKVYFYSWKENAIIM